LWPSLHLLLPLLCRCVTSQRSQRAGCAYLSVSRGG
jgi:hypothetical protein